MEQESKFTFVDLFSGIGGFRMALAANGGSCLGFSEISRDAVETYCDNFAEASDGNLGDVRKIEALPPHDLLTAGVPCQSWSIAGKNLGFDDDRGQLWNDTLYLLKQSRPKAFIFENVKGLVDPRNESALGHILERIREAGYHARHHVINSCDHGVPQNRVRVYIVGFRNKGCFERFRLPPPLEARKTLGDLLGIQTRVPAAATASPGRVMSLSSKNGFNDYFLFNDLRNGDTTIHSWDILETTDRQKHLCHLLLQNRRKRVYGRLDGNPLSLPHFQSLDPTVALDELLALVDLGILEAEEYLFDVASPKRHALAEEESMVLACAAGGQLVIDDLKGNRSLGLGRGGIARTVEALKEKGIITCREIRYDFKNTKISTGLFGVNRIFLPSSDRFPTLVASDTTDYIALDDIEPTTTEDYRRQFLEKIYRSGRFRRISKREACLMQGFPGEFRLPDARARWMKLVGNSVSVPVIDMLCKAILETGVFAPKTKKPGSRTSVAAGS